MHKLIVLASCALLIVAAGDSARATTPGVVCPRVQVYSAKFAFELAAEQAAIDKNTAIFQALNDYLRLRERIHQLCATA